MTIKQQGGIFGRNPSFNDVDAEQVTVNGTVNIKSNRPQIFLHEQDRTDNNVRLECQNDNFNVAYVDDDNLNNVTRFFVEMNTGDAKIVSGNLIIGTSGKGIDFSATSGTGTSELFDDYEEGTWSPDSGVGSVTAASGVYTKIGRQVSVIGTLTFPVQTNAGLATITGLPFTSGAKASGGTLRYTTFGSAFFLYGAPSATTISCFSTAGAALTYTAMSGKRVDFTYTYFT